MASSPKQFLVQTLGDSANQIEQNRVRDATLRLEEWRTHPGFFSTLQEIFLDSDIPEEIRFQSIIYLKNNIDRYWRKTAANSITDNEKVIIRERFLVALTLHLPRPWIATNAYAIGRISRHDFPRFWPDLVTHLLSTVRHAIELEEGSQEQWCTENALIALAAVIKELSSVKLGMTVSAFHRVTPQIFRFLGGVYEHVTRTWVGLIPSVSPKMVISSKSLGIMRNLLVYGYEKSGEQSDTQTFFDLAVNNLSHFYQLYNNLQGDSQDAVLRQISKLTKLFATYASERPFEFLIVHNAPTVINTFVQICQHEAEQFNKSSSDVDEERMSVLGKVVIGAISTVRDLLRAVSDPKILDKEREKRPEAVTKAQATLNSIFTSPNILQLAALLLRHFLILRQSELDAWEEDPEEWVLESAGDLVSTEGGLRTTAEALFMDLISNYKDDMFKFMGDCIQSLHHSDMSPNQIIFREAVYNAISLNALHLYDAIDFDDWLITVISQELSYNGPHVKILRRRMALLISEWVGVKCSEPSRPKVYESLLMLLTPLDPRNDVVVRMSAASALRYAVDEWNFKQDTFMPYLDAVLVGTPAESEKGGLIGLMGFVRHIEARMKLIQVVDVIVDRMDRRIAPYVPSIMNLLPYLWEQSQEQRIFRASVLSVLKTLTGALGERSIEYHPFIVQLITLGTDPTQQEEFVYLFEDALDLWEEAIKNAPTEVKDQEPMAGPEYNFMGLFPKAIACLQLGSENLKKILKIIEAYLILDPVGIMKRYAKELLNGFSELMVDLKPESNRLVMSVVETAIQACPVDFFIEPLVDSGMFLKVLTTVVDDNEHVIISAQNTNILARIALQNPNLLLHLVRTTHSGEDIAPSFVDRWSGPKFDGIGQPKSRKLNAMGLTALLRTNDNAVLSNLGSIMNVWFNVLSEVKDSDDGDALIYWQDEGEDYTDGEDFGGNYTPSPHERRRRIFLQHDPVHSTNLMTFMKEHLALVQRNLGGVENFREVCLRTVDEALVDQMNTMFL